MRREKIRQLAKQALAAIIDNAGIGRRVEL